MTNKKAQGLPLSFIVLAAVSALVLILIVTFTVGGFGGFSKQIMGTATSDISMVRDGCRANCNKLAASSSASQWMQSDYCEKTYAIDVDGDGKAGGGECVLDSVTSKKCGAKSANIPKLEVGLHCWDPAVGVSCTQTITTPAGGFLTCSNPDTTTHLPGTKADVCAIEDCP